MAFNAILLDIEGTTTPIDFVHNTLFPFAKARVSGFVQENIDGLKYELTELASDHSSDGGFDAELNTESANSVAGYLKFLIDADRKSTALKSIQGMIWQKGYESGDLVSPLFDDVPAAFKRWKDADKTIAIFSSGSILAQRMIFKHSDKGDLTQMIDRYFDTTTGPKRDRESYRRIAEELELDANAVVFVSDTPGELDAARAAGMQTVLTVRPGNVEITEDVSHRTITTFDGLDQEK